MRALIGFSLACLLLAGCATEPETKEVRQQFEALMDRAIGKMTYEEVLTNWGPPSSKQENASTISGVWEEPSMQGERVQMTFDRRSQKLKAWSFETK